MENSQTSSNPSLKKLSKKKAIFVAGSYIIVFLLGFIAYDVFIYEPTVESYSNHIDEWADNQEKNHMKEIEKIKNEQKEFTSCNTEECLIGSGGWGTFGVAALEGYYQTYEGKAWGEEKTCDAFHVIGGSKKMRDAFNEILDQGNTINSRTNEGELLLNLDLTQLDPQTIQTIKSSNQLSPIKLKVMRLSSVGEPVPVCHSLVETLRAESI